MAVVLFSATEPDFRSDESLVAHIDAINKELVSLNFLPVDLTLEPRQSVSQALTTIAHLIALVREKRRVVNSFVPKLSSDIANREMAIVCPLFVFRFELPYFLQIREGTAEKVSLQEAKVVEAAKEFVFLPFYIDNHSDHTQ
jgi:hypothetical protein